MSRQTYDMPRSMQAITSEEGLEEYKKTLTQYVKNVELIHSALEQDCKDRNI
jgi:hypothetical protein